MAIRGRAAATAAVGALTRVSSVPPSSVKVTCALTVLPSSAEVSVYVAPAASAISASSLPSFAIHFHSKVAFARPSASAIPDSDAVSVSPTFAVPEIVGNPVGAALPASVTFVTASPVNPVTGLPAASCSGLAPSPVGTA